MDESCCSLTAPPSASIVDDFNHHKLQGPGKQVPPCFTCGGTGMVFPFVSNSKSYLRSGEFQKLIENEPFSEWTTSSVLLYDMAFSFESGILTNLKQLFAYTRKQYYLLKMSSKNNTCTFLSHADRDISTIRRSMVDFLYLLKSSLQKMFLVISKSQVDNSPFCKPILNLKATLTEVLKELKQFLLFVRRISELPYHSYTLFSGSSNDSPCHHLVHFCLDMWWSSLEVMHTVHCICSSQNIELNEEICSFTFHNSRSAFSQTALLILWDLCFISLKNYKNFCLGSSPFPCPCIQELWIMLIILLDRRHEIFKEGSFWEHFDFIVRLVVSKNVDSSISGHSLHSFSLQNNCLHLDKPEEFFLWIINHVSPLYKFSVDGMQLEFSDIKSCYSIVRYLVESVLALQVKAKQEKHLRTALSFCGPLIKLWEPSGDILLPLTDFFLRHVDDSFCLPGFEIRELSYLFKMSTAWAEHIHKIISLENYFTSVENSFYLYLHILGVQLEKSGSGGNLWRQLKGRIYSRLTSRRLKELSEAGLQNCFSLLLVIAYCGFSEVSSKISELIGITEVPPTSKKKQAISWKSSFALMIFHEVKSCSIENEASKLVCFFNKACLSYKEMSADSIKRNDFLNLILIYLENVVDIFEKSTYLGLSEFLLIGTGFSSLLPACSVSELNSILEIILSLLTRFQTVTEYCQTHQIISHHHQHTMLWESLYLNILPFVMRHSMVHSAPIQLADIAVAFTVLAFQFHDDSSVSNEPYFELFRHFGTHKNTSGTFMCRYLCFVLHDLALVKRIKAHIPDFHVLMLQSWLKCGISSLPPCTQIRELTKVVFSLEEIIEAFPRVTNVVSEDHGYAMIRFFRVIDESHQRCSTLQEKANFRQKIHMFFQTLPPCVTSVIRSDSTSSLLHHVYKVIGHLFQYCAPCLYIKSKSDCVLPILLDTLIFPHIVFLKDKEIVQSLSAPIKEHLSLFVRGLARLDFKKDSYVCRKLKEIVIHYIGKNCTFAITSLLEIALDAALEKSETMNRDLFFTLIEIVRDNFLVKNSQVSCNGAKFCMEIFKRVSNDVRLKLACNLVECLLEQLLLRDDSGTPVLKELLKMILTFFQDESNPSRNHDILLPAIKTLIEKHLPWSTSRVYRWLEYISLILPSLMSDIIPFLTKTVECVEKKRGVGCDFALRNGLKNLVNKGLSF